jgi:hypothetical protein
MPSNGSAMLTSCPQRAEGIIRPLRQAVQTIQQ